MEKLIKCPSCQNSSELEEWNDCTLDVYGHDDDTTLLDEEYAMECVFVCPSCKNPQIDGAELVNQL